MSGFCEHGDEFSHCIKAQTFVNMHGEKHTKLA
jgi:hypothetical protein